MLIDDHKGEAKQFILSATFKHVNKRISMLIFGNETFWLHKNIEIRFKDYM